MYKSRSFSTGSYASIRRLQRELSTENKWILGFNLVSLILNIIAIYSVINEYVSNSNAVLLQLVLQSIHAGFQIVIVLRAFYNVKHPTL